MSEPATGDARSKSVATRIKVLNAAARTFRAKGYAATTLNEIAEATSMRAGSLYYHFDSKEQLVEAVFEIGMQRVVDEVRRRVAALPDGADFSDRLRTAVQAHLEMMLLHGDYTSANIRIFGQVPKTVQRRQLRLRRAYGEYWRELLEEGKREGAIRKDADLGIVRMLLFGALNWTVEWFDPRGKPVRSVANEAANLILQGIVAAPMKR
jgi:AcrR family transcriptional regulator